MKRPGFAVRALLAALVMTGASFNAIAQDELNADQITERIQAQVERYARSQACAKIAGTDAVLRADMIGALQPYQLDTTDPAEFVGFWSGDSACAGGTAGTRLYLVNVKTDEKGNFFVDPQASEPAVKLSGINPRFLQRVVGASLDTMTIEGSDFAAGETGDFPSRTYRYTMKRDASGNWAVTAKKDLG